MDQEFAITFGAENGTFNDAEHTAAEIGCQSPDFLENLIVQGRITHNAPLADLSPADFELRLDQGYDPGGTREKPQSRRQNLLQRDKGSVDDREVRPPG